MLSTEARRERNAIRDLPGYNADRAGLFNALGSCVDHVVIVGDGLPTADRWRVSFSMGPYQLPLVVEIFSLGGEDSFQVTLAEDSDRLLRRLGIIGESGAIYSGWFGRHLKGRDVGPWVGYHSDVKSLLDKIGKSVRWAVAAGEFDGQGGDL